MPRSIKVVLSTTEIVLNFGLCVVIFALTAVSSSAGDDTDAEPVHALRGETVQFDCPLLHPRGRPSRVEWHDFVYNEDREPRRIFTNSGGRRAMDESHPNRASYDVEQNYSLVVRDVTLDDVGKYTCTSRFNETVTRSRSYYLSVSGIPSCDGTAVLNEGESANFSCFANYSGREPILEWRRGTLPLQSIDLYDVRLAKKDFKVEEALAGDDGTTFTCRLTFGTVVRECHVNLTVHYTVRDLVIDPIKESYAVGEEIRCSANGNPNPDITIRPALAQGKTGVGWRSVTIPKSAKDQTTDLECLASNTVNGKKETIAKTLTLTISGAEDGDVGGKDTGTEKPKSAQSASASSSGAIVGGIVVGVMILVLIVAAVFCIRLRNDRKSKKDENGDAKSPVLAKETSQKNDRENRASMN